MVHSMQDNPINNEQLEVTLERIIILIGHCDTKVSYLLSVLGVIMTVLITAKTPKLTNIQPLMEQGLYFIDIFAIFIIIFSILPFIYGIYCLVNAMVARTNNNSLSSHIFFGDIAKFSCYQDYMQSINNQNYDYKADLLSQIYQNSKICSLKFSYYNKGFKFCCYSLPFLIVSWLYLF